MLLLASLPLFAQIDNGNITGRVTDGTGGVIANAKVTLIQTETNFETAATTNGEGIYRALSLRPGPYRITVFSRDSGRRSATASTCGLIPRLPWILPWKWVLSPNRWR